MSASGSIHIGTCAWSFDDWRGVFYPEHLPSAERLAFYARHLRSVEVDSTFYAAPAPRVAEHWAEVTPADFVFAAKMPREITHERGLRDCAEPLRAFLESLQPLHGKLACVLIQLPPYFTLKQHEHTLRDFIRHLPASSVRYAIEFRDPAWHLPRIAHLLEEHGICWAWNDVSSVEHGAEAPFAFWPHTTDFLYLRLLGDLDSKYAPDGGRIHHYRALQWPRETAIDSWAEKVRALLPQVRRVLVCVSNHYEGFAPQSAARIAAKLGLSIQLPTQEELTGTNTRQLDLL